MANISGMKNVGPEKRYASSLPKIGIRPVIDGRQRGVRESLEDQTMNMAKAAAQLISSRLRYPDGSPVTCVIADSTIGRVPEAAACAEKFEREGVGLTLSVTPCWCYGTETLDMHPFYPKAIWGFNGTERPGAVYLAAALAGHAQKVFRLSVFTDSMYRIVQTPAYRPMWKPRSCVLSRQAWLLP